ncbi:MAG TPA: cysteine desulfurase family protein [Nitrososphaera sp.]|nr:cysteine desulfurase family protein [Nitrososphaera sp.]
MSKIYLDYAAATPLDDDVLTAMRPFLSEQFYNPSATYNAGRAAKRSLDDARGKIASILGARPSEIVFTAGGTEADNLAVRGVMARLPDGGVLASAVEHEAVLKPVEAQAHHALIPVDATGQIDMDALAKLITDNTVLISVMYANNEVGTIQPLRKVVLLAEQIRAERRKAGNSLPLYVHTDACQAANYLDLHVARLGVDLMTLNGGKIYGPKQTGVLYIASHVRLEPQITGGGQERNLRSGTENVAGAVGFSTALEKAQNQRHEAVKYMQELRHHFVAELQKVFPDCVINGSTKHVLPNNTHVTFPGQDNERILFALDERGIMAAAGSACSASNEEPSHVLRAMGISEADAQASIRFTMGRDTTKDTIDQTVKALADILSTPVY